MLSFVVARYKEDIAWIDHLPADAVVHLYNKGPAIAPGTLRRDVRLVELRNAGRESGTYMHHLMHDFRADAGDFTVFTQGDPFEHAPGFLDLVRHPHLWRDVQPLSVQWVPEKRIPPPLLTEGDTRDWIGPMRVRSEHFSLMTWAPLHFFDEGAWGIGAAYRQKHRLPSGSNIAAHFLEFCGLEALAAQAAQADLGVFSYGAIFAVRNARIAAFLETARAHLEKIELLTRADLNYGYIFERLWLHFFGEPFIALPGLRAPAAQAVAAHPGAGNSELRRRAYQANAAGRLDEAVELLQQALAADPRDHDALCDLATMALQQNDPRNAAVLARRAVEIEPGHGVSLYTLAMALFASGDPEAAVTALLRLERGPAAANLLDEAPELAASVQRELARLREAQPVAG